MFRLLVAGLVVAALAPSTLAEYMIFGDCNANRSDSVVTYTVYPADTCMGYPDGFSERNYCENGRAYFRVWNDVSNCSGNADAAFSYPVNTCNDGYEFYCTEELPTDVVAHITYHEDNGCSDEPFHMKLLAETCTRGHSSASASVSCSGNSFSITSYTESDTCDAATPSKVKQFNIGECFDDRAYDDDVVDMDDFNWRANDGDDAQDDLWVDDDPNDTPALVARRSTLPVPAVELLGVAPRARSRRSAEQWSVAIGCGPYDPFSTSTFTTRTTTTTGAAAAALPWTMLGLFAALLARLSL
ncbi:uncharacterized protein MONBRDRAFT_28538 [Monosiga brevicollis MX1]|uniref:Uncharacterized protein n=1 Tax=Monosiga brevicollis TaxID=81824 RepID=A9V8G6_MONBE|nr:uncharacterized protein MONBRDRAFT_28538 [Monosiga brevicollis MX1]EDQ86079.1 predicted protein [Monosiga brevicollis MX1]|eukprot:XP_001749004.1 hypothetical protein [Monosiga brevicollis MX1]